MHTWATLYFPLFFRLKCRDGQAGKSSRPDDPLAIKEASRWTGIREGSRGDRRSDNPQTILGGQESYSQPLQDGNRSFWCAWERTDLGRAIRSWQISFIVPDQNRCLLFGTREEGPAAITVLHSVNRRDSTGNSKAPQDQIIAISKLGKKFWPSRKYVDQGL